MVRHKSRWLLVQFDYEPILLSQCTPNNSPTGAMPSSKKRKLNKSDSQNSTDGAANESIQISQITTTDIFRSLQDTLTQNYGIVASCTTDISVRFYDPKVRLAVIKTSRENYPLVRSSIMFLTKVKQINVVASTISVSGSARTARNAAWKVIQKLFFDRETAIKYGLVVGDGRHGKQESNSELFAKKARVAVKKALAELEERMDKIDSSC
ncbi:hypothetical protein HJC23_012073 [Cyclotella cryptica]|uniref:Uncharacterized protein n=1 Tax=Cyclotella cryptica TaxID=29204 RepID=A0ABD3PTE0_9STRA|eukprot:CCRYP_011667-RA/>CCRYP_011667-RA protein AED:0.30 eAED:0.30 QI:0/-1/0/1/-1/1/1/0/209